VVILLTRSHSGDFRAVCGRTGPVHSKARAI
jgi:hypothetical protein